MDQTIVKYYVYKKNNKMKKKTKKQKTKQPKNNIKTKEPQMCTWTELF